MGTRQHRAPRKRGRRGLLWVLALPVLLILALVLWQPRFAVRRLASLNPGAIFYVDTRQPIVALTLDDGPHPTITPQVLDLLAAHDAHATFFLIGERIGGNEEIVRRLVREGHEAGNHHMADRPSIRLEPADFERQLLQAHDLISQFGPVTLFRPGSGWFNQRMIDQLADHGYSCVLGTAYPEDLVRSPHLLWRHILFNTQHGSIIILHDGPRRGEQTLAVLRHVLPELRRRGYRVVTVSDLLDADQRLTEDS